MFFSFNNSYISSLLGVLPKKQIPLEIACKDYADERTIERLKKSIGFEYLRVLDTKKTIVDMAYDGIKYLCANNIIDLSSIDALIFATETPDHLVPAPSYILQKRLNIKHDCMLIDMIQGCSGFVNALFYANTLLENKSLKNILICCGDVRQLIEQDTDQKLNASLFSDGLVIACVSNEKPLKTFFNIHNDGKQYKSIINESMSGCAYKYKKNKNVCHHGMYIDGPALANYILGPCYSRTNDLLNKFNFNLDSINYVIAHQANEILVKSFASRFKGYEDKILFLAKNTGNTGPASIGIALSEYNDKYNFSQGINLFVGFGVGLSYASAIVDLSKTTIFKPLFIE